MDAALQSDKRFGLVSVDRSQRNPRPRNGKRGTRTQTGGGAIANRCPPKQRASLRRFCLNLVENVAKRLSNLPFRSSTRESLSHRPDKNHILVVEALLTLDLYFGPE